MFRYFKEKLPLWLKLFMLTVLITGCSFGSIYGQLDWLGVRYINNYFPLTSSQKQHTKQNIQTVMDWHKAKEVPQYLTFIEQVQARDIKAATSDQVYSDYLAFENALKRVYLKLEPYAYQILMSSTSNQLAEFSQNLDEKYQKQLKKYDQSKIKLQMMEKEKFETQLDKWFGSLTFEQEAKLDQWAKNRTPIYAQNNQFFKAVNQKVAWLIANKKQGAQFRQTFRQTYTKIEDLMTAQYQKQRDLKRRQKSEFIAYMLNSLDDTQVKKYKKSLNKWHQTWLDVQNDS